MLEPVSYQLSPSFTQPHKGMKDRGKENLNFGRVEERSFHVCALAGKWSLFVYIITAL